jgi:hypothetical protein
MPAGIRGRRVLLPSNPFIRLPRPAAIMIEAVALSPMCHRLKRIMKVPIFVLTRINPLTPTLSPRPGGEGRACPVPDTGVRGNDPSILFQDNYYLCKIIYNSRERM